MKHFVLGLSLLLGAAACVRPQPRSAIPLPEVTRLSVTHRANQYRNEEMRVLGIGTIAVIARPVDSPTIDLDGAVVELRSGTDSLIRTMQAKSNRALIFDSVLAGSYTIVVRRIAFIRSRFPGIQIEAGCRTDLEAYLALDVVHVDPIEGVAPPAPAPRDHTPPRATVTYCGAR